tara:strand:- start:2292 stop:2417 length:126 start_codon:yes stop_codon:yes gene_type:complete
MEKIKFPHEIDENIETEATEGLLNGEFGSMGVQRQGYLLRV